MTRQESLLALNNFLFLAVIKLLIFAGGLLPLAIVLGGPSAGGLPAAATILAALAAPFLIALEVGVVCRLLPKPVPGRHPFFSKHYYRTLRLQEIHEVVANTTFLNNLVHRVEPLRLCVHRLLGLRKRGFIIVAPDVRLLDPYMIRLGARVFIGMECNISAHIVVGPSMWIQPVEIGDRALIGAACQISCATAIGDDVKLDYGVLVSHGCTIGRESVVLRTTFLASGVRIGERVTIGAGCRIGKDAVIGDSARIGDFAVITGGAKIAPGARVPDAAVVGGGMEARDLATGSG